MRTLQGLSHLIITSHWPIRVGEKWGWHWNSDRLVPELLRKLRSSLPQKRVGANCGFGVKQAWVGILTPPLPSCVTFGK